MFKVSVTAGRYTDRNLPTASWYDVYEIEAGEYPVDWVTKQGYPVDRARASEARVTVRAVLVESYREDRLLSSRTASTSHLAVTVTVTVALYPHDVRAGLRLFDGLGVIVDG